MTIIQKNAQKHASKIQWDTEKAIEYAVSLLEECNLHTEAAALVAAHDAKLKADSEIATEFQFDELSQ